MKITILNGSPQAGQFDTYLAQVGGILKSAGHAVTQIDLRTIPLRPCIGCFGCWTKTPGMCVSQDASIEMDRAAIHADFLLWAAPLEMGFPTELLKMALDKHLPLIHPYIEVAYGEAHHLKRYPHYPRVGLLVEREAGTDERDLQIVADIHGRTAINFKTRLEFSLTTETPAAELARRITGKPALLPLPERLAATSGAAITPPGRLALFNGSPRGSKGNTPIMLGKIGEAFSAARGPGAAHEIYHLVNMKETERMAQAFADAECAVLGFPLYTDSMPGIVKHFIEALRPFVGRPNNPPLGFLVQSGFPEALHSRYVERYLEKLAARLGSPYLGTIVKGNGEGIRFMPPDAYKGLFDGLQALGSGLATQGRFDPAVLRAIAGTERYPAILWPVFQVFLRLPMAHGYFDDALKKNGVYEQRFARPFQESR